MDRLTPLATSAALLAIALAAFRASRRQAQLSRRYSAELFVARRLALACGAAMRRGDRRVAWKDAEGIDPVTATDQSNERLVLSGLHEAFPEHEVLGEEQAAEALAMGQEPKRLTEAPTWIVDPIDGTTNFVYGMRLSCAAWFYTEIGDLRRT